MDAYTHRLDPSEDWPLVTYAPSQDLEYVENHQPEKPVQWKSVAMPQSTKSNSTIHEE